jgi:hypothetical protein
MSGEQSDWAFGFVRTVAERRLAVLIARFPAYREAEPDWRAYAHLPEQPWLDLLSGRPVDIGFPLREWMGPLPFAVLTSP